MKMLGVLLACTALSGCAAMSEAECRTGDWYGVGETDGRSGQPSRLGSYAEACQKIGVLPDPAEYSRGRERGLLVYCTPENGYRAGVSGQSYENVCAPERQAGFLQEYERGRVRYELRRDIDALEQDMARWSREIQRVDDLLAKKPATEEARRKLQREREGYERDRRDGRVRLLILQTRFGLLPD